MRLILKAGATRSRVGLAVGIAAHLVFQSSLSDVPFCSLPPTKHLVLMEDEV